MERLRVLRAELRDDLPAAGEPMTSANSCGHETGARGAAIARRKATRLRVWKPSRRIDDETSFRLLAEQVAESPNPPAEVLAATSHNCATCRRIIVAGELAWTWKRMTGGGWFTFYVCPECPKPAEAVSRVDVLRLFSAKRRPIVVRTGRAGRPALFFAPHEVELIRELRAEGFGEYRLAREFFERTGRRVSARSLSKIGRD